MPLQGCYIVKIYVPAKRKIIDRLLPFRKPLRARSCYLPAIINVITHTEAAGRLGTYQNVYELARGEEYFTPQLGAHPEKGRIGKEDRVKSLLLTVYLTAANFSQVEAFVANVAKTHPWEHPVIECISPEGSLIWIPEKSATERLSPT